MSNRSKHSPPDRGISHNNGSDDELSTSSTRDKFRRERSLDDGAYIDSYEPKSNDYGRHSRSKRHLRSPSPDIDRRHKYRRTSPTSPPPPPPLAQHHSHRYRGNYTRSTRDHDRDSDGRDADGDHYIPNYDRDGYTPGARYGRNTEPKQQQNHHHQRNRRRHSQHPPQHQHQQRHPHHQVQQNTTPQLSNYGTLENMMAGGGRSSPMSRIPLVDFQQLDYVVPFKQYCDYLRQTQPKTQFTDDDLQKQYDDYKEKINNKQLAKFFTNNKEKQWFLEKYHPQISKVRLDDMKERRHQNFTTFMQRLEQGHHDTVKYDVDSNSNNNNNKDIEVASSVDKTDVDDINGNNKSLATEVINDSSNPDYENHLVIKTVPPTISRQKIIDMCKQVDGFQYLALSEPSITKKFHRIGWIHFAEETDMQKVFDELDNQTIDDFVFHLAMNKKNQSTSGRTSREAPEITNTLDRLTLDLNQATQLAKKMDMELERDGLQIVIDRACQVMDDQRNSATTTTTKVDDGDRNSTEDNELQMLTTSTKKKLDLILTYLRLVHMYCYYCGLECDSTEELNRRCLDPHLRKLSTSGASESKQSSKNERMTQQWIKNLDQRIEMKISTLDDESVMKIGGKSLKREIDAFLADHIEKEHDAKYKCKVGDCAKAFKGIEFVEKHICSKHGDEIQRLKDDVMFYNNYACDPNHLVMISNNNNNNNNSGNNYGILSQSGHISNMMNNGSNNNNVVYGGGGSGGGGASPFMMSISPMQAAAVGTPWDQIPRIGFGGNVGWSTPMAGRLGGRLGGSGGSGKGQSSSTQGPSNTSDMVLDIPQDPREVKSYVDLDAPADGDSNISFY